MDAKQQKEFEKLAEEHTKMFRKVNDFIIKYELDFYDVWNQLNLHAENDVSLNK